MSAVSTLRAVETPRLVGVVAAVAFLGAFTLGRSGHPLAIVPTLVVIAVVVVAAARVGHRDDNPLSAIVPSAAYGTGTVLADAATGAAASLPALLGDGVFYAVVLGVGGYAVGTLERWSAGPDPPPTERRRVLAIVVAAVAIAAATWLYVQADGPVFGTA